MVQTKKPMTPKDPREYSEVIRNEKPNGNPLAMFAVLPSHMHVEIQDEQEKILLLVRKHVITNIPWVGVVLLMALAPLLLGLLGLESVLPMRFVMMTFLLWYLLTTAIALEGFLSWYFDVFVITDERIIDIDFTNLIYKNITTTKIDNIEDVTYNLSGAIPSLLNYGTVLIQTAGSGMSVGKQRVTPSVEIINTPKPALVAKLINELILEEEQEKIEGRVR